MQEETHHPKQNQSRTQLSENLGKNALANLEDISEKVCKRARGLRYQYEEQLSRRKLNSGGKEVDIYLGHLGRTTDMMHASCRATVVDEEIANWVMKAIQAEKDFLDTAMPQLESAEKRAKNVGRLAKAMVVGIEKDMMEYAEEWLELTAKYYVEYSSVPG